MISLTNVTNVLQTVVAALEPPAPAPRASAPTAAAGRSVPERRSRRWGRGMDGASTSQEETAVVRPEYCQLKH